MHFSLVKAFKTLFTSVSEVTLGASITDSVKNMDKIMQHAALFCPVSAGHHDRNLMDPL